MESEKAVAQIISVPLSKPRATPPLGFEGFFREHYKPLLQFLMYVGATRHEADDAVASAMAELLRRWGEVTDPAAYARKAAMHNFIKTKTRDKDRTHLRPERDESSELVPDAGAYDPALSVWEDWQWVRQLLDSLPPTQRAVMSLIIDGYPATKIAELLGKTSDTVRQNLRLARLRLRQHPDIIDLPISRMPNSSREETR